MSVLYVKEQGAFIHRAGARIEVTKQNKRLLSFPVASIEGISIMGNIQISTQALTHLLRNGVDVSIFSYSGEFIGQINANASKNIFLRIAQYDTYQNMNARIDIAKTIVYNKIRNQMQLIRDYRYKDGFSPKKELNKMRKMQSTLDDRLTANEILGVEGMCSHLYFTCFAHMINCSCKFQGRNRRPPRDPVNVILSLGYTFLTREVCTSLEAESFEMYLGFLHGVRYGRKSLALDIVEEFRQPVIDRLVIRDFNKRIINEFDFETGNEVIRLKEEGFRKFCQEYERWISGKENGYNFRQIIRDQASSLKKALLKRQNYVPYQWKGERDDICNKL